MRGRINLSAVCFFILSLGIIGGIYGDEVNFPDPNLEAAIREAINKPEGPITDEDLVGLTELNASNRGISDLTGIEHCTNLRKLNMSSNQISNISPLSELINLQELDLGINQISDITILGNLINLQSLSLAWNQISDITPVEDLVNLQKLHLEGNQISDITPLSNLSDLKELLLAWNQINNITPIGNFINLQVLWLEHNQISDITALGDLINLHRLNLRNNQVSDITPLSNLTSLKELVLGTNRISNIDAISNLTDIQSLYLDHNWITDITPLRNLINLKALWAGYNLIDDISPLGGLTNLQYLQLRFNRISHIQPLVDNPGIGEGDTIDITGNPLTESSMHLLRLLTQRGVRVIGFTDIPSSDMSSSLRFGLNGFFYRSEEYLNFLDKALDLVASQTPVRFGPVGPIDFPKGDARSSGDEGNDPFDLGLPGKNYVARFTGYILIPKAGGWKFALGTDDGCLLKIAGHEVTKFEGSRGFGYSSGVVLFDQPGWYGIEILMFQGNGAHGIEFRGGAVSEMEGLSDDEMPLIPLTALSPFLPTVPGDVSGNFKVTAYDASLILQYIVGLIDRFPVEGLRVPNVRAPAMDREIRILDTVAHIGERVRIPLLVNEMSGLYGGGIWISYDPEMLRAKGMVIDETLSGYYVRSNMDVAGEIRLGFVGIGDKTGPGRLAWIEFEVLREGESEVRLEEADLANSEMVRLVNGEVRVVPYETALLPNYPNPFNPETWIPFRLAEEADVRIRIYDMAGNLIRTLDLGCLRAGYYTGRSSAAYWDGRNEIGERVASGVYVYQMVVGGKGFMRRMVMLK
jgi:internalin A